MKLYFVYIMASKKNGTLYIGSTSDLPGRVTQHKQGLIDGFTKEYGVKILVYFEEFDDSYSMVTRERQLKKWNRAWKIRLIEEKNPLWVELDIGQDGIDDFESAGSPPARG
jgi:putative endonuclease